MKIKLLLAIPFSLTIGLAQAEAYPFPPISIQNYTDAISDSDRTRLRLAVSVDSQSMEDNIRLTDLVFCSASACFRPATVNYFSAKAATDGNATIIFDSLVPHTEIKTLHFGNLAGDKRVAGKIDLSSGLKLEKGFQGGEIFLKLQKNIVGKIVSYTPKLAVSQLLDRSAQSVYYDPAFPTSVKLPLGIVLRIPEGATDQPQIFSVAVRDVGKSQPGVDIFPYMQTKKDFRITLSPSFEKKASATVAEMPPLPTAALRGAEQLNVNESRERSFNKTGNLKLYENTTQPKKGENSTDAIIIFSPDCPTYLQEKKAEIDKLVAMNAVVNINYCEGSWPWSHIVVSDYRRVANRGLFIGAHEKEPELVWLHPITHPYLSGNSYATVNGFYWDGDAGTGPNQLGRPAGYVKSGGSVLGVNHKAGVSQGNKYVMMVPNWLSGPGFRAEWMNFSGIPNYVNYNLVVSSSTSIVKNGICTESSDRNRWSAIGETNGRVVLISSNSGDTTNSNELCPVFKALGIQNAIRLDGGPSAAMTISGVHVNPLVGLERLKYGNAREIAYTLKFTH